MKKALIYLGIIAGIIYVAKKVEANAQAQIEAKKKQIEERTQ